MNLSINGTCCICNRFQPLSFLYLFSLPAATCPRNSHYEVCATGCPVTCHSLSSPKMCHLPCKEGCQCNNGFLLSGDECVPIAECGCVYGDQYYKKCEVFYPKGKCEEQCKCSEDGAVTCKKFSCGANEECKVVNGVQGCHPVGQGKCVASGDPHYISFDGLRFNFMGTCTYTLAKLCDQEGRLRPFSVDVENVPYGNGKVSVTKMVKVVVYDYVITINQGMRWKVIVSIRTVLDNSAIMPLRVFIKLFFFSLN